MPKAAATINAAVDILPAERIAAKLMEVLTARTESPPERVNKSR